MGNKDKEFGSQVNLIQNDKSQKKKSKKESSKPETILENGEQVNNFYLIKIGCQRCLNVSQANS